MRFNSQRVARLGLVLDMVAVLILGFQPMETLWGTGVRAKYSLMNGLAWGWLFLGFGCQFIATFEQRPRA